MQFSLCKYQANEMKIIITNGERNVEWFVCNRGRGSSFYILGNFLAFMEFNIVAHIYVRRRVASAKQYFVRIKKKKKTGRWSKPQTTQFLFCSFLSYFFLFFFLIINFLHAIMLMQINLFNRVFLCGFFLFVCAREGKKVCDKNLCFQIKIVDVTDVF